MQLPVDTPAAAASCGLGTGPSGWDEILAITFTNAAAGEMRDRVIGRLKAIAEWREHEAQGKNIPRGRIARDETLADIRRRDAERLLEQTQGGMMSGLDRMLTAPVPERLTPRPENTGAE